MNTVVSDHGVKTIAFKKGDLAIMGHEKDGVSCGGLFRKQLDDRLASVPRG